LVRSSTTGLLALDEVGYVPLAEVGAEFLFQVIAERAEKAAAIVTTNLPFSEWTQVIPNARLCKASIDRITDAPASSAFDNAAWPTLIFRFGPPSVLFIRSCLLLAEAIF